MDIKTLVGLGAIPIIQGLIGVFKTAFPGFPSQYLPALAMVLGIVFNVGMAYILSAPIPEAVVIGLVAGLASSGFYQVAKELVTRNSTEVK